MTGPIIQRFSRNSFRWNESQVCPIGPLAGFPGGACILPRTSVLFARISLADLPERHRDETLRLELEQRAPFDEPAGWVVWQGAHACVWYWPKELQTQIETALKIKEDSLAFVPETIVWPELKNGHYRWIESTDKKLSLLQYQHPHQGLYEKRCLTQATQGEVTAWLNRHGAQTASDIAPEPPPELSVPRGNMLGARGSALESRVFPLITLLLCFFIVAYGVAIIRASAEASAAKERAHALEKTVEDTLSVRTNANMIASDNAILTGYLTPSQVDMAAVLADALDIQGGRLLRWQYRSEKLELSWMPEGKVPDTTGLITILEAMPQFSRVLAQVRGGTVIDLSMQVNAVLGSAGGSADE